MLPGTVAYVSMGAGFREVFKKQGVPWKYVALTGAFIALVLVAVAIGRRVLAGLEARGAKEPVDGQED